MRHVDAIEMCRHILLSIKYDAALDNLEEFNLLLISALPVDKCTFMTVT